MDNYCRISKTCVCIGTFSLCFLLLSSPLSLVVGGSDNQSTKEKAVSGVYVEYLPSPILYDTFLPMLLEYILPHWNKSDVTFNNWYNCTSETIPYRYTCPSVYHMNRAVLNLHIDFLALQPVKDSVPHHDYYTELFTHSKFCSVIQRHFSGIYIQDDELGSYIQSLEKCNSGGMDDHTGLVVLERNLPDFNFSIRHPFTKMESNFYNVFYKSITGVNGTMMDLVASALLSNARATIQGTLLSVYYAEKYRWTHAVQDCNSAMIPHSLITSHKFNEKLDTISKHEKFRNNYEFSIPMSLISKYYNLPIADCTYTNETFVVRLQIPLTEKSKIHQSPLPAKIFLVTLTPAPFVYRQKVCSVQLSVDGQRYLYDTFKRVAYKTQCKPNELCYKRDTLATRLIDPCATAVLNQDFQQVVTQCKFQCFESLHISNSNSIHDDEEQAVEGEITRVGTDKYIVTGQGVKGTVKCQSEEGLSPSTATGQSPSVGGGETEEAYEFHVESEGALEVTLPCTCYMEVNGRRFSSPSSLTTNFAKELTIQAITPWHLLQKLDGNNGQPDEGLVSFYTSDELSDRYDVPKSEASTSSSNGDYSTTSIWIFFGITSLILFLIQGYIIYILHKYNNNGGNYTRHQLFFKAAAPEPQVGLLETQYDQM